jgi:hypothetical protein
VDLIICRQKNLIKYYKKILKTAWRNQYAKGA